MISLNDIDYFLEIAQVGHISKAAQRIGISQPALSHCIHRLEKSLDAELFIRSKKGVQLTSQGRKFFEKASDLKHQWEQLEQVIHDDSNTPRGLIKLGVHTAVAQYTLPHFVPELLAEHPQIKLQLHHGLSRHITEKVNSSEIDVGLVVNPTPHPDLVIKELCKDVVTLWKNKKGGNDNVLLVDPSLLQAQDIVRKLGRKKLFFDSHLESGSLEVLVQLLMAGAGQAILPTRVVKSFASFSEVESVPNAPTFSDRICLIYKHEFRSTSRAETFIDAVRSTNF